MTDEVGEGSTVWYPDGTMPLGSIIIKWFITEDGIPDWDYEVDNENDDSFSTIVGYIEMTKTRFMADSGFQAFHLYQPEADEDDDLT